MVTNSPTHYPHGGIRPGAVINPRGQNGHMEGWQPYGRRSWELIKKYSEDDIRRIVMNTDGKQRKGISTYDIIILTHLAGTIDGGDRRLEREALLDRIEGKAPETVRQEITTHAAPSMLEYGKALAFILTAAERELQAKVIEHE